MSWSWKKTEEDLERPTRSIVPASDMCPSSHHLGDTDSLALSTTDTTNECITYKCIFGVTYVEHFQESLAQLGVELFARNTRQSLARSFG